MDAQVTELQHSRRIEFTDIPQGAVIRCWNTPKLQHVSLPLTAITEPRRGSRLIIIL